MLKNSLSQRLYRRASHNVNVPPIRALSRPRAVRSGRRFAAASLAAVLLVGLGGCVQDSGNATDVVNQGYQSGDGSVRTWPAAQRLKPVKLTGTDFAGGSVDTSQWLGDVVVVNTWYAACPPCRAEAPALVRIAQDFKGEVHLLGINTTDAAGAAEAFQRTFTVPYPSIEDRNGAAIATLQGVVPIQAVPTTVILDQQGRVAARVLGEVEETTLRALIKEVLEASPTAKPSPTKSADGTVTS